MSRPALSPYCSHEELMGGDLRRPQPGQHRPIAVGNSTLRRTMRAHATMAERVDITLTRCSDLGVSRARLTVGQEVNRV
jgi:hypothetical protein